MTLYATAAPGPGRASGAGWCKEMGGRRGSATSLLAVELAADSSVVQPTCLEPTLPDYGGACLSEVVPALYRRRELAEAGELPAWLPTVVAEARQVVLLVLDGLGWRQLTERRRLAPTLSAMSGGPITSVAPTTTATALTSIATGCAPARHGIIGYRLATARGILNVLRWTAGGKDARASVPPERLRRAEAFCGHRPPVITRAEFAGSGFTEAHLHGVPLVGWRAPSSISVEIARALRGGAELVYAYYDGIDKIAHEYGLHEHYDAELTAADRLVADAIEALVPGAALLVTADHGQVEVARQPVVLDEDLVCEVALLSGEGRFRWLHARPGRDGALLAACRERYSSIAWVRHREELVAENWFGGELAPEVAALLGDVALVASAPVAFYDPADSGELRLISRHGSLTADEVLVPLLAAAA